MNWGEWYSTSKSMFSSNAHLTFSKALSELKSKNKILPTTMIYFIDFNQIESFHQSVQELKSSFTNDLKKNSFDDEIGEFFFIFLK